MPLELLYMAKKIKRDTLFPDFPNDWEREWQGMPEFIHKDKQPYRTIIVHFDNKKDVKRFAKIVKQNLTPLTKSIWYPKVQIETYIDKKYTDKKTKL